jgi:hypothetical protein
VRSDQPLAHPVQRHRAARPSSASVALPFLDRDQLPSAASFNRRATNIMVAPLHRFRNGDFFKQNLFPQPEAKTPDF